MHELSLCQAVSSLVQRHSQGRAVSVVHLQVGAFRQVVPATMVYSWEFVIDGTDLEGSRLEVEQIPAVITCAACGTQATLSLPILVCGNCASADVALMSGEEFMVTSLELSEHVNG